MLVPWKKERKKKEMLNKSRENLERWIWREKWRESGTVKEGKRKESNIKLYKYKGTERDGLEGRKRWKENSNIFYASIRPGVLFIYLFSVFISGAYKMK